MQVSLGANNLDEFSDGAICRRRLAACGRTRVPPPSAEDAESREPAGYGNLAFARLNTEELAMRGRDFRRFVSATATKTSQT